MKAVSDQKLAPSAGPDTFLLRAWLHGRQPKTIRAYEADARRFLTFVEKPLADVTLEDLQRFDASMAGDAHASRARRVAAVKSLFAFAQRMGAIPLNPAAALRTEKLQHTSAERMLEVSQVTRMIGLETDPRRRAILKLLYVTGIRASEACGLRWRDLTGNDRKGGEAKVLGKGAKLRSVIIPAALWRELVSIAPSTAPDAPVAPGQDGKPMSYDALHRLMKRAAKRAGLPPSVSAHWMRHAHASHALAEGCNPGTLQASLGHASLATTTGYLHLKPGDGSASFIKV